VSTLLMAIVVVAAVLIVVLLLVAASRARRRAGLKRQFGPEYERMVDKADDRKQAERELSERADRRSQFEVRQLSEQTRQRYGAAWREVQTRFVDAPADSVQEADVLVTGVMRDCGYPVEGFADRNDFVSVDHPHLAEDYRAAHRIAVADTEGKVTTEDRRQAMVHFRSLFTALLGDDEVAERQQRAG
jgi:hypothetical protein